MMSTETLDSQSHRHLSQGDKLKLRQNEKFERNYRHWQQAKAESKQDQYKHLKQRVALQHDLIRAQDELAYQKREKEQHYISQKRNAQKASKHAREEALLNICRQSLDEDKRNSRIGKQSRVSCRSRQAKSEPSLSPSPEQAPRYASSVQTLVTEQLKALGSSKLEPGLPYKRHTLSPCLAEDDEDEKVDQSGRARKNSVPWHHAQLYRLYGDKADYFLYPKIEPKPQKQLHPKLRNPGGGGAEVLWAGLRNESVSRLRRYDRNVSKELKVPDLPQLLDKTLLHKACALRHKLQLMHRSSLNNADRTRVLTYNNPFPDMNNLDGEDSIDRYLPSWMESDYISEPEYRRWLQGRQLDVELQDTPADDYQPGSQSTAELLVFHKKPHYLEYPKLKFLQYEKDSDILEAARKLKEKDQQVVDKSDELQLGEEKPTTASSKAFSAVASPSNQDDSKYTTTWQPLSMQALVEYTQRLDTEGDGPFHHGQTKMWQTVST